MEVLNFTFTFFICGGKKQRRRKVAIQGRRVQITINQALRARGKMLRGKSNGLADCLVVEMLSRLPTQVIYEVTNWFQKRFQGDCRAPKAWCIFRLVFLKKL